MSLKMIVRGFRSAALQSVLVLASACVSVQVSDSESGLAAVEKVERARFQAWVQKDTAALTRVIADDVVYCHSTGVCQNKAELIGFITGGQSVYRAMDVVEIKPQEFGDTIIVNGKLNMKVETAGKLSSFQAVYTDVYVKRDGRWQLVRWQSTRLP
jgi:ketosteroid isomerase-like protein